MPKMRLLAVAAVIEVMRGRSLLICTPEESLEDIIPRLSKVRLSSARFCLHACMRWRHKTWVVFS